MHNCGTDHISRGRRIARVSSRDSGGGGGERVPKVHKRNHHAMKQLLIEPRSGGRKSTPSVPATATRFRSNYLRNTGVSLVLSGLALPRL